MQFRSRYFTFSHLSLLLGIERTDGMSVYVWGQVARASRGLSRHPHTSTISYRGGRQWKDDFSIIRATEIESVRTWCVQRTVGDPRCGMVERITALTVCRRCPGTGTAVRVWKFSFRLHFFFSLYILNLTILSMRTDDTQWLIVIRIRHCVCILFDPDANLKMLMDNTRLQFS